MLALVTSSTVISPVESLPLVSTDLLAASYRSDTFPQDWTREQRETSLHRYEKWLRLKQLHPKSRLAPTLDIDLFWHLHMLSPVAYHRDCMRHFGRLLDHDGGFGKGPGELELLKEVFLRTERYWEEAYHEPYRLDGTLARDAVLTDCWHDCQDRCWHACSDD
jgi:hypothetical protein